MPLAIIQTNNSVRVRKEKSVRDYGKPVSFSSPSDTINVFKVIIFILLMKTLACPLPPSLSITETDKSQTYHSEDIINVNC